ncbi:MAG: aminotransferase class I/II-fold pyridoxal phosphate-dependent enzyme [Lachnospiraceae bacterium]|nr:aminotransferase class I/II-fold pyridoxal phosphate-dependent enzyme [Lachnospiraceae bacterium]
MKPYSKMTKEELESELEEVRRLHKKYCEMGLHLNMARGKPSGEQLDLAMGILNAVDETTVMEMEGGLDARNYGGLEGLEETKQLIASMTGGDPSTVLVYGNSSLNMMFDTVNRAYVKGICGATPWKDVKGAKFLCPAPGYDRHFAITEYFGLDMITIPMTEDGPDMDMVEDLVNNDPLVKGIWCVPKFTNPQGYVYSNETVHRFAHLRPAAEDFRIFWDNAYCVHYLYEEILIPDLLSEAADAGHPDMVFEFTSTSKVSFAGAGISAMLTSRANIDDALKTMSIQTIGHDKINQLRHIIYFENGKKIPEHMASHAAILRPKFEAVQFALERDLEGLGVGTWTKPRGGYFITYETLPGCAKRTVELAKEAGMVMTAAGAPYPYGKDPNDTTIRIAPSYPKLSEIVKASDVFTVCVRLAALEKLLGIR